MSCTESEKADYYSMEDASAPATGEVLDKGPDEWNESFEPEVWGRVEPELELAIASVDLGLLDEGQVEDLESGDPEKVEKAVRAAQREEVARMAEDEDRLPGRISLKAIPTAEEKRCLIEATQMLRDGRASSLREALDLASGTTGPDAAEPAQDRDGKLEANEEKLPAANSDLQMRIDELERQRKHCRDIYDFEQADQLLAQIVEARAEMRESRREQQVVSARVEEFAMAEDSSRERALQRYADFLETPDSEFNDWLDVEIALAEKRNDPILNSPDWPEKIADRTFQRHMVRSGGGTADFERDRGLHASRPSGRTGVRMPGSPVGGGANSMALTASAAMSEFERLSPEEQKDVLDRLDRTRI